MKKLLVGLSSVIIGAQVYGAGFEKSVLWSAKWASLGGNAASSVTGADAVFYNPAGLAGGTGGDISLNYSPTQSSFKGPVKASNESLQSEKNWSPVFAALGSYKINEKLGVGAGYYVSGGTNAEYKDVDFSGINAAYNDLKPTVQSKLAVTEFALGAGYQVTSNFRLGAAWRAIFIKADLGSFTRTNTYLLAVTLKDLEDKNYGGFKLGGQYTSDDKNWGVGFSFRNAINFEAEGPLSAKMETIASTYSQQTTSAKATVENTFPWNFQLDGFYQAHTNCKVYAGWTYTKYSKDQNLVIKGTVTAANVDITDIVQKWKDQNNFRLGTEYNGIQNIPIRVGYVYTTQVTDSQNARATFSSPGAGHTFTLGSGYEMEKMHFLLGLEKSMASGNGTDSNGFTGKFESSGTTINTTFKLFF